jgi:cysteinyl-tRNA synthetase
MNDSKETLTATDLSTLKVTMNSFIFDVLGLEDEK